MADTEGSLEQIRSEAEKHLVSNIDAVLCDALADRLKSEVDEMAATKDLLDQIRQEAEKQLLAGLQVLLGADSEKTEGDVLSDDNKLPGAPTVDGEAPVVDRVGTGVVKDDENTEKTVPGEAAATDASATLSLPQTGVALADLGLGLLMTGAGTAFAFKKRN